MHCRFEKTINVDGTVYEAGAVVDADAIAKGSLASLLYTNAAKYCDAPKPVEKPKVEPPKPEPIKAEAPKPAFTPAPKPKFDK